MADCHHPPALTPAIVALLTLALHSLAVVLLPLLGQVEYFAHLLWRQSAERLLKASDLISLGIRYLLQFFGPGAVKTGRGSVFGDYLNRPLLPWRLSAQRSFLGLPRWWSGVLF